MPRYAALPSSGGRSPRKNPRAPCTPACKTHTATGKPSKVSGEHETEACQGTCSRQTCLATSRAPLLRCCFSACIYKPATTPSHRLVEAFDLLHRSDATVQALELDFWRADGLCLGFDEIKWCSHERGCHTVGDATQHPKEALLANTPFSYKLPRFSLDCRHDSRPAPGTRVHTARTLPRATQRQCKSPFFEPGNYALPF